jgi:hypothetical protein
MRWIESAGGPLLLLSEKRLGDWGGVFDLISGPAATASYSPGGKPTDYDRACSVDAFIGVISVGTDEGVVLGDEPMRTAWIPYHSGNGGIVVRWVFGESEEEFLNWIDKIPESLFQAEGAFNVKEPRLLLFDSAAAGCNVATRPEEYLSIELQPGRYQIRTAVFRPDKRSCMVVHSLELCSGPPRVDNRGEGGGNT